MAQSCAAAGATSEPGDPKLIHAMKPAACIPRCFLLPTLSLVAVLLLTSPAAISAAGLRLTARPNILLILVDDMGWATLGCYGGMVETPNLDRLANRGVRFSQFYNAGRCCPSRASLMTGLHPHEAGIGHMTFKRTGRSPSVMAERLRMPYAYRGWLGEAAPTLPGNSTRINK